MRILEIYETGEIYESTGNISMGIHQGKVVQTIDVTHATPEEIESLKKNPNQKGLIDLINKRG